MAKSKHTTGKAKYNTRTHYTPKLGTNKFSATSSTSTGKTTKTKRKNG